MEALTPIETAYLKRMVLEYMKTKQQAIYGAVMRAKRAGRLNGSDILDDKDFSPYVVVTTHDKHTYCMVGYDINGYTLRWIAGGDRPRRLRLQDTVPSKRASLHEIIQLLLETYALYNTYQ
jgi:hypothetical protein